MYNLQFTGKAIEDLQQLESGIADRIMNKLKFFVEQKNPILFAKKLINRNIGQYRFRIGDYRAIFDIDHGGVIKILLILRVKHRKDIYCE